MMMIIRLTNDNNDDDDGGDGGDGDFALKNLRRGLGLLIALVDNWNNMHVFIDTVSLLIALNC